MFQSIQLFDSGGDDIANKLLQNIAFNGLLFVGGAYTLIKTLVGIDYDTLEDFDTKSWAREAGKYALQGTVPSEYVGDDGKVYQVATFAGGCFVRNIVELIYICITFNIVVPMLTLFYFLLLQWCSGVQNYDFNAKWV